MSAHDGGLARRHATALLERLGIGAPVATLGDHPALAWRRTGLLAVTGREDGRGLVSPIPLTSAADGALAAFRAIAPQARLPVNGALLLGERARLLELRRRGATSANGSCRLIATRDGGLALNLPRAEDWEAIPALLGEPAAGWAAIEAIAATRTTDHLVTRGRLLGLAIAADRDGDIPSAPFALTRLAPPGEPASRPPLVIDLSALWAGPLAASLLWAAGAHVVKVESRQRPDGARAGNRRFFDLLNAGKASLALDFSDHDDLACLHRLIDRADIVIESTRPRALEQLGIHAEAAARRGATWVSITGHGRDGEAAGFIGFGDDAAVAGGLAAAMRRGWGETLFAGDAIADPLTGITAAFAAWAGWRTGGGIIALSLSQVVAHARGLGEAGRDLEEWQMLAERDIAPLYPLRSPTGVARPFGADTRSVLATL